MIKREHPEKRERAPNEPAYTERKKKKRRQKFNSSGGKYPNDLKSSLYNMCLNFAYSDIYQDYINRLSLNCQNNCDYDQIRRSPFIPREDFFKYYNFPLYDNNFELESEQFYEDEIWKNSDDDVSGVEEVGKYVLERYDAWRYKARTSRIKNLILGMPDRKGVVLPGGGGGGDSAAHRRDDHDDDGDDCDDDGAASTSYASQLFRVISQRKNCNPGADNHRGSGDSRVVKFQRRNEMLSESIRGYTHGGERKSCLEKVKRQVLSFCNKVYDARDPSFMSSLNIYFLNYHDIGKRKIKNAGNEDYICMVQNLAEAQADPLVGRYYKGVHMVQGQEQVQQAQKQMAQHRETHPHECVLTAPGESHFKEEDPLHGQAKHSVDELADVQQEKWPQSSQKGENETGSAPSNGLSEQHGLELEGDRNGRRGDKKVRLSGNWDEAAKSGEPKRSASKNMKRLCSEEIEIYFKKVLKNEIINFNQKRINKRDRWNSLCQFVCSCIGASLTAQCYVDLPPISSSLDYALLLLLLLFCYLFIGLPILQMEYALGQLSQGCIINGLSFLKKKYRGVAIASLLISFCVLSRGVNDAVDTAIVVVSSVRKPLPWNLNQNQCEGIPLRGDCLRKGECIWVTASTGRNDALGGHPPERLFYPGQQFNILNAQMRSKRNRSMLSEIQPKGDHCTSDGTSEWHRFFSKDVKLVWKIGALFLITLTLYFLLRVEGMCLTQCLQYTFFLFFFVALFQIFVLSCELKSTSRVAISEEGTHPIDGHTNGSIFFSTDYFFYLNFEVIAKVCTLVLVSLNCSTGVNYLFSSYSNVGDNLFASAWYVVLGSFIGVATHMAHYYVCVQLLSSVPTGRGTLEVMMPPTCGGSPNSICSLPDLFSKRGDPINNFIVYMASLSRVNFQNMMSFTYFLCSLLALLTSSALHLKGIILVLKESRKFKGIKKKVITLFVIVGYCLLGLLYLSPFGHNANLIMKYATSTCVYLFVVFAQVVCITWTYASERGGRIISGSPPKKKRSFLRQPTLCFFTAMWMVPPAALYLHRHIFPNFFFSSFGLPLLGSTLLFVCVNAFFICSANLKGSLREKLYWLYFFNVDTLRTRLNKILHGRRRSYDLAKGEEHPFAVFLFQKLTIHWCFLMKFFIPQILLTIVLSNVLYNVHLCLHRGVKLVGLHSPNQYGLFAQGESAAHSYLRSSSNGEGESANLGAFSRGVPAAVGITPKGGVTFEGTYQDVLTKTASMGGAHTMKDTKRESSFGGCVHLIGAIAAILLTLFISLLTFARPNKMNCLACTPTNTWKISDVDFKRMNPVNYAYTRCIHFWEEIFPIERIMPPYVRAHISKQVEEPKPVTSLHGDDPTDETIHDKSFSYLNKTDYENYIFNLIDRGSKLSHFPGVKGGH
ncbi:amino acid transporter, putative [Plasmodium vivax]|nr:amino acid transporter, putative [Plasmodium vivax]